MVEQVSRVDDHLTRVALVARALTASMQQSEIVDIVVRQGMAGLSAEGGVLAVVTPDGAVVPVATVGYPPEVVAAFGPMTVDDDLPLTVAARDREAVWLESPVQAAARFPAFVEGGNAKSQAWVVIPLVVDDSVLGVLGVSFLAPHVFSESDRLFMQALGDQCALAMAAHLRRRRGSESADAAIRALVVGRERSASLDAGRILRADPRFVVRECDDHEALGELTGREAPDLVMLAGDLPEASRVGILEAVGVQWPAATVVVLTSDPAVEEQARHLGVDAVFGLSVPAGWLQAALAALVEASASAREPGVGPPPRTSQAMLDSHALSSAMFDASLDAVLFTAPDGQVLAANRAACRMLGMSEEEIRRRGRSGLADPDDPRWVAGLQEREATGRFFGELSMLRADGSTFPVELSSAVFEDDGGARRTVVVLRDVSARKEAEELLTRRARVDELTGALNRRGFFDVAPERLREAWHAGDAMTLLFVDVDGLKDLNDDFDYATGDAGLRETVQLLREACRDNDLVARFGGDEFVVLGRQVHGEPGATLAKRIENRFHLRNAQGPPYPLRISVGAAHLGVGGTVTLDEAIAEAHSAMRAGRVGTRRGRSRARER